MDIKIGNLSERHAPLTWGQWHQQYILDLVQEEAYRQNILGRVPIPHSITVERLSVVIVDAFTRFESLRTLYPVDGDSIPSQRVLGSIAVELPVHILSSMSQVDNSLGNLLSQPFNTHRDLPIRFSLFEVPDRYRELCFSVSHLSCDAEGAANLEQALHDSIHTNNLSTRYDKALQPCDRAKIEFSAEGKVVSNQNALMWTKAMSAGTAASPAPKLDGRSPRFHEASLDSSSISALTHFLSERYRVPVSASLFLAMSESLMAHFNLPKIPVRVAFHNRLKAEDVGVDSLSQWGLVVHQAVSAPIADRLHLAQSELLESYMSSRYNTLDVLAVRRERLATSDVDPMSQLWFNVRVSNASDERTKFRQTVPRQFSGVIFDEIEDDINFHGGHIKDSPGLFYLAVVAGSRSIRLNATLDSRLMDQTAIKGIFTGMVKRLLEYVKE